MVGGTYINAKGLGYRLAGDQIVDDYQAIVAILKDAERARLPLYFPAGHYRVRLAVRCDCSMDRRRHGSSSDPAGEPNGRDRDTDRDTAA